MPYEAKVLAHSVSENPAAPPLFTMQLRYPKFLHAEELTHRVLSTSPEIIETVSIPDGLMYGRNLSRNASSSRAVLVPRLIEDIRRDPAEPLFWGKNQAGMQAAEELDPAAKRLAQNIWRSNREACIRDALDLHALGAHKQLVNRLVEKHGYINVVVTATNWSNFFALRRHEGAQPEIRHLADLIWGAQQASTPTRLGLGQWHLPYVTLDDLHAVAVLEDVDSAAWTLPGHVSAKMWPTLIKLSVARCARVSYLTHEGKKPSVTDDLALYDRLVGSTPLHASPAEHQASPDTQAQGKWVKSDQHGNLTGYMQFRKMLTNEFV
jgi:Thymidylate synthase complementing protein